MLAAQARQHLLIRYQRHLIKFGSIHPISEATYVAANLASTKANIRSGLVPDGQGEYIPAQWDALHKKYRVS